MDIYLPIAGLSVNALLIVVLGFLVGMLSGMFGVGGGFLTTPLLIFYGIPPTVAVASATTQITGASVSGVYAHLKRGGVDLKMGGVMVIGVASGKHEFNSLAIDPDCPVTLSPIEPSRGAPASIQRRSTSR